MASRRRKKRKQRREKKQALNTAVRRVEASLQSARDPEQKEKILIARIQQTRLKLGLSATGRLNDSERNVAGRSVELSALNSIFGELQVTLASARRRKKSKKARKSTAASSSKGPTSVIVAGTGGVSISLSELAERQKKKAQGGTVQSVASLVAQKKAETARAVAKAKEEKAKAETKVETDAFLQRANILSQDIQTSAQLDKDRAEARKVADAKAAVDLRAEQAQARRDIARAVQLERQEAARVSAFNKLVNNAAKKARTQADPQSFFTKELRDVLRLTRTELTEKQFRDYVRAVSENSVIARQQGVENQRIDISQEGVAKGFNLTTRPAPIDLSSTRELSAAAADIREAGVDNTIFKTLVRKVVAGEVSPTSIAAIETEKVRKSDGSLILVSPAEAEAEAFRQAKGLDTFLHMFNNSSDFFCNIPYVV